MLLLFLFFILIFIFYILVQDDFNLCNNCCKELKQLYNFRRRVIEIHSLYIENDKPSLHDKNIEQLNSVEQVFLDEIEPVKQEEEANFEVELLNRESDTEAHWDDEVSEDESKYDAIQESDQMKAEQPSETNDLQVEWSPNSRFKCESCPKSFSKRSALSTHELSHLNLRDFTCPHTGCKSAFNVFYRLLRHMRNVHSIEEDEIEVFKEKSRKKLLEKSTMKIKPEAVSEKIRVQCEICLKVLSNVKYLKEHMILQHLNNAPYVCDKKGCNKKFTDWSLMEKHQKKHEGKFEFKCTYCSKDFVQRKTLNQHLKKSHQISQEEIDKIQKANETCSECGLVFKNSQKLSEHKAILHQMGDKFQCDFCGKIFFSRIVLISHQKYHKSSDKKKKCLKCPSTFIEAKGLKTHMRRVHKMTEVEIFDIFMKQ